MGFHHAIFHHARICPRTMPCARCSARLRSCANRVVTASGLPIFQGKTWEFHGISHDFSPQILALVTFVFRFGDFTKIPIRDFKANKNEDSWFMKLKADSWLIESINAGVVLEFWTRKKGGCRNASGWSWACKYCIIWQNLASPIRLAGALFFETTSGCWGYLSLTDLFLALLKQKPIKEPVVSPHRPETHENKVLES